MLSETERLAKNARQRERYANDPEYRETFLARQREACKDPDYRAKRLARKKRWQRENREKYLAQSRRQNEKRRLRPEVRAEAVRRARAWRDANPEKHLDLRYGKYGMSYSDYDRMLATQGSVCAICRGPETSRHKGVVRRLAVDHDHATGKVRALLCHRCNHSLGRMRDDPELLRRAADYLEAYA